MACCVFLYYAKSKIKNAFLSYVWHNCQEKTILDLDVDKVMKNTNYAQEAITLIKTKTRVL